MVVAVRFCEQPEQARLHSIYRHLHRVGACNGREDHRARESDELLDCRVHRLVLNALAIRVAQCLHSPSLDAAMRAAGGEFAGGHLPKRVAGSWRA